MHQACHRVFRSDFVVGQTQILRLPGTDEMNAAYVILHPFALALVGEVALPVELAPDPKDALIVA